MDKRYQSFITYMHCVSNNIPNVFDRNLKKDHEITIIFGTNIPKITGYKMSI